MEIIPEYQSSKLMEELFSYLTSNAKDQETTILTKVISYLEMPILSIEESKWIFFILIAYHERILDIFNISPLDWKAKFQAAARKFADNNENNITALFLQLYKPLNENDENIPSDRDVKPSTSANRQEISQGKQNLNMKRSSYVKNKILNENEKKIDGLIEDIRKRKTIAAFIQEQVVSNQVNFFFLFPETLSKHMKKTSWEYKLKLLTCYSKCFFLFSDGQKKILSEKFNESIFQYNSADFDPATVENIKRNILSLNTRLPSDRFLSAFFKEKKINLEFIQKNIYEMRTCENIKDLYLLYCLNQTFRFFEITEESQLLYARLSFILYFSLTHFEVFDEENQYQFLCDLYIIKEYYSHLLEGLEYFLENKNGEIVYQQLNFSRPIVGDTDFGSLFSPQDKEFAIQILDKIKHFYKIDSANQRRLVCKQNIEFTMNIVDLIFMKQKYIYRDIQTYQKNLINLEKQLYSNYKQTIGISDHTILIQNHNIPSDLHITFNELNENLHYAMSAFCTQNGITFTLYPFGSITQFLGSPESDLDIYLELNTVQQDHRIKFLERLFLNIRKFDMNAFNINSHRLCLITFHYNGLKIDLNYFGIFPVLHSLLLRTYSLIDIRFSILAINIKKIIKKLGIYCTDKEKKYLNTFSWMMLLITFLQDIVNPPILPKLLDCSAKETLKFEVNGLKKKSLKVKSAISIKDIIENSVFRDFDVGKSFEQNYNEIYNKFLIKKNEMSLSELLLQFIEFVIFYFKYDTVFVHCSFEGESFMNLSRITEKDTDKAFQEVYGKFNTTRMKKPKGDILIREPFDNTYNPAQTMVNPHTKEFIETLKRFYFSLLITNVRLN